MSESTKFELDQQVVYPSQGVGKITEIFEKTFNGKQSTYYRIYLEVSDMIVMVPIEKAEELGIRPIVSEAEAKEAIDLLGKTFEPITSDWKQRYQMNLDLLKKGSIADIATIVRCLYNRSKIKELPILERKLYDNAKKLLEDEISFAMNISAKEAESMIHTKLEPPGAVRETKHILEDLDDDDEDFDSTDETTSRSSSDDDDDDDDEPSAKDDASTDEEDVDDDNF